MNMLLSRHLNGPLGLGMENGDIMSLDTCKDCLRGKFEPRRQKNKGEKEIRGIGRR